MSSKPPSESAINQHLLQHVSNSISTWRAYPFRSRSAPLRPARQLFSTLRKRSWAVELSPPRGLDL